MSKEVTIDLRRDAEDLRRWIGQKISAFRETTSKEESLEPVGGIVVIYCYVQVGWIALDFNTDEVFEFVGEVSKEAWDDLLKRPQWLALEKSEGPISLTFVEPDGTLAKVSADEMADDFHSGHFGKMIADVLNNAWNDGVFSSLMIKPGCVVSVNDFNGNWAWEAKEVSGKLVVE